MLDITKWADEHPGGAFSINFNIGRDVSKYFHGGYSLENKDKVPNHAHSVDARRAAQKFIVARLNDVNIRTMKVKPFSEKAGPNGVATVEFEPVKGRGNDYVELCDS